MNPGNKTNQQMHNEQEEARAKAQADAEAKQKAKDDAAAAKVAPRPAAPVVSKPVTAMSSDDMKKPPGQ